VVVDRCLWTVANKCEGSKELGNLFTIATLWLGADGNNTDRAHWDQLIEDLLMAQAQVSLRLAAAM
jgi:hypothetical protein